MTDEPHTPSEAYKAGKCPGCLGTGRVERCVPYDDTYPCSTCGGEGTLEAMWRVLDRLATRYDRPMLPWRRPRP